MFFRTTMLTMVDNRGSKIISCAHKYHKSIVNIVVKTKKYKASCFLERQCSTMFDNRRSDIIYCAHEYYKMIVKHCQYCR